MYQSIINLLRKTMKRGLWFIYTSLFVLLNVDVERGRKSHLSYCPIFHTSYNYLFLPWKDLHLLLSFSLKRPFQRVIHINKVSKIRFFLLLIEFNHKFFIASYLIAECYICEPSFIKH
jgi:hypothetical protein